MTEGFTTLLTTVINENTLGAIILAAFFTLIGIIIRGLLANHGSISVAKIESDTTLGTKAMETLTKALEVLQEENRNLKNNISQLESHIDTLIDYIIAVVKSQTEEEQVKAILNLEQYLKSIGRWPY